ncbi:uroporphyrinogen-III C-methyltransferase [Thiohalophilus sp.]|uniref:uroporphyrinogen-III C-methyltransferase n=1 Tax=Thiohalophilus sp. TaxID=3028392 RepID=UPI002ACE71FE|nr:uroporphyrinogen-III C-methyltransferase [Thiohalophilus sp.]MDZ7661444.1 uroporphyrinogen-III C-methyltransferase [Thiohalophilus sp.]
MNDKDDNEANNTLPDSADETGEAPQQEAGPDEAAQTTPAPKKAARGGTVALFFALLSLLALIALAGGGYYLWQDQQQLAAERGQRISSLQDNLANLQQELRANNEQQGEQLADLRERQSNLDNALENLLTSRSHLRNDWLLTEAEYLLKLANHRLLLERDVETAIVALQSADARLREMADPGLLTIRKRIAADINDLRSIAQPDLAGLSFNLSSLAGDITRLPLATPDPQSKTRQGEQPTADKVDNWRELPAAIWRDIKSLVVIRHHDEPIQPLLAPEQRFFLTQNLQLQLEQARLALLNGQTRVYQERLQQARQWLETYFDTEHNATRQAIEQLRELAGQEIHPQLPDISDTHQALLEFRQQRQPGAPESNNDSDQQDSPSS